MSNKLQYRLSKSEKIEISQNLINILTEGEELKKTTRDFIAEWVNGEKIHLKAFSDVWEFVLKNYLPSHRPILYRSTHRVSKNGKIASFTSSYNSYWNFFLKNRDSVLIICDTERTLLFEEKNYLKGHFRNTFYPLSTLIKVAKDSQGRGFYKKFVEQFEVEDEYIMRINLSKMETFRVIERK